jgi:RNA polymerase sigma-70 factor, ECF subfamily
MLVVNNVSRASGTPAANPPTKLKTAAVKTQDSLDDTELVAFAREGNRSAFEVLFKRYQRKSIAVAAEIMRSRHDAEDVVQDAFVKAFRGLKSFKGEARFSTWLYRIIYTTAIDAKRKKSRRGGETREFEEGVHGELEPSEILGGRFTSPDRVAQQNQEMQSLSAALGQLSEEHRLVLTLREIDGLAYDEIADVVGVNKGTVMSRLFYARKRLQEIVAGTPR